MIDYEAEALKTALDALEEVASGGSMLQYTVALSATVIRLRERCGHLQDRNDELKRLFELQRERARPWIERWRVATGKTLSVPDYGDMLGFICDRGDRAIAGHEAIRRGIEDGRVGGEDVVWFDTITTLWEHCVAFCDPPPVDDGEPW